MRIGVIASPWIPVPPPAYGGTETVIHNLCVGLQELGHEVHLVTVGDSTCPVRRSSVFDEPPTAIGEPMAEIVQARAAYAMFADVDVIHDHTTVGPQFLPAIAANGIPVVTTVHGPFHLETRLMYRDRPAGLTVVAISHAQRATAPDVEVDAVIHHGVDLDRHRAGPGGGGYLMFIGRMSPDKGPDRAIEVARRAGMPLVLAAKMREQGEIAYFEQQVRPLLGPDVTFVGESDAADRVELLRHAEALVNPIRWHEPFGLVMAEALACATPVVALRFGAAPEIVDHGRTGFLCDDLDDMVAAVDRLGTIERRRCREAAQERFSLRRMASDHEVLYEKLVASLDVSRTPIGAGAGNLALATAPSGSTATAPPATTLPTATPTTLPTATPATAMMPPLPVVTPFDPARKRGRHKLGMRRRPFAG
jgi:glycosyltransferase involved in cell wall biosynthesis